MTSPNGGAKTRAKLIRRLHERQAAVFGLLIAAMLAITLGGAAVLSGVVPTWLQRDFTPLTGTNDYANLKVPCLPKGTKPVSAGSISINVINGANVDGLGTAVAEELTIRGFKVHGQPTVTKDTIRPTLIRFGTKGEAAAYTLGKQFDSPVYYFDARKDAVVDVVVGTDFDNMIPVSDVKIDASKPLANPPGCTDKATPQPAATLYTPPPTTTSSTTKK